MRGHMDGWHRCISLVPLPKTSTQKQWSSGQTDSGQTRWRGSGGNEPLKGWAQWAKISGKEPPSSPEIPANLRERKIPPGNVSRMKYWKTFSYRANTPLSCDSEPFHLVTLAMSKTEQRNVSITSFNLRYIKKQDYFHASWQQPCQVFQRLLTFIIIRNFLFLQIILLLLQDYQTDRLQLSSENWKDRKQML